MEEKQSIPLEEELFPFTPNLKQEFNFEKTT
jgi:hypothetical protein